MNEYREKLLSIGVLRGGRSRPTVVEGIDAEGAKTKAVTDELGNTVTEHNNSKDQVDVHIRAPHVKVVGTTKEVRSA